MRTKNTAIALAAVAAIATAVAYQKHHSKGLREVKREDKTKDDRVEDACRECDNESEE